MQSDMGEMMKNCIIFGAGFYGRGAYHKLKNLYKILYYVDNNASIQGQKLFGIRIISVEEILQLVDLDTTDIIICSKAYSDMAKQLWLLDIRDYYVMLEGFLYHCSKTEKMMPVSIHREEYYKKPQKEKNMLFIQNTACIRTHKIASLMKSRGYKVFLLYTIAPPVENNAEFAGNYTKIFTVFTMTELIDFVNESEFDIVHCSNEPDFLTNLLLLTNKKIVFDTHDTMSLRAAVDMDEMTLEYIANTKSAGVMFTSKDAAEIAKKRFPMENHPVFYIENMPLRQTIITKRYEKISKIDKEIHCVYEGGINGTMTDNSKFFELIWKRIADCGIHIHFYSQSDQTYCKTLEAQNRFFHYEGTMEAQELINELTKYDCGLAIFNVNDGNRSFLETGTANKMYEYINAGLPVLVGNINSYIEFVEKYDIGKYLDPEGDIVEQIKNVCKIKIPDDFLQKHALTMDFKAGELEEFYNEVMFGKGN